MANNEYGDFQTNAELATKVVGLLGGISAEPATIVEPTCGKGNFIAAARASYPDAVIHGLEIQSKYVAFLEKKYQFDSKFILHSANYFKFDWEDLFQRMTKPVWVIGNPPWVTNSQLVRLESDNLPKKSPQAHLTGFEAQTGKSNFDISESMIRDWFHWCHDSNGCLAVICKTSVARKVLHWWWRKDKASPAARIYNIDAQREFGATVSACVLVCSFISTSASKLCEIRTSPSAKELQSTFGLIDGHLVADASTYRECSYLLGKSDQKWRSGIKHDAGKVLELVENNGRWKNKSGEEVEIEDDYVFPLLKGSDLHRDRPLNRKIIVPQSYIGQDTLRICQRSPRTWKYLSSHKDVFDARKSVIYSKGPDFSIFGIGDYTFKLWKIAIAALYKKLVFRLIGPQSGKPVIFDDTIYFLGFDKESDAREALIHLESAAVQDVLGSMIFWDDMRPVKTDILNRIKIPSVQANDETLETLI